MARLKEGQVREIRKLSDHESDSMIAERFGVTAKHVRKIIRRETWAWLD
jgi:hypothetical protein